MLKKICCAVLLGVMLVGTSGCGALLGTALSAGAAYGLYMATKK